MEYGAFSIAFSIERSRTMKHTWNRAEAWGKTLALFLASTLVYFAYSAFLGLCLPVEQSLAVAVGVLTGFPAWVAAMCYAMLARNGRWAWAGLLGVAILLGLCVTLVKIAG